MTLHSVFRIHLGIVFLSAFLPYAASQQGGTGGSAGNTGGPGRRVAPQRPQSPPAQASAPAGQSAARLVVLSGTVLLEDGSPPPFGAVIEMNCGGEVSREANVGFNGSFSIRFGGGNGPGEGFPDASRPYGQAAGDSDGFGGTGISTNPGAAQAWRQRSVFGCELRAKLQGYMSTSIILNEEPVSGPNEIGTIILYPNARVRGNSVSLTTLMVSKPARRSLEQAQKAIQKQKFDKAEEFLRSAVREYPQYAEAWFLLGEICERDGRTDEAGSSYSESLKADPMYVWPYLRLARLASIGKRWREASDLSEKLLELDPVTFPEGYFLSALAHLNLDELQLAEQRAEQGQRLDVSNRIPQFRLILADIFALRKNSEEAVQELRDYLKIAPHASNAGVVRAHLYLLEKQTGTVGP